MAVLPAIHGVSSRCSAAAAPAKSVLLFRSLSITCNMKTVRKTPNLKTQESNLDLQILISIACSLRRLMLSSLSHFMNACTRVLKPTRMRRRRGDVGGHHVRQASSPTGELRGEPASACVRRQRTLFQSSPRSVLPFRLPVHLYSPCCT